MSTPRRDMDYGAIAGPVLVIAAVFWALAIIVCLSHAELPAGMHRSSIVRADTVWSPHTTLGTRTLDSLDSLWRVRGLTDRDRASLRCGYRSLQEMDSLSREGLRRIKR